MMREEEQEGEKMTNQGIATIKLTESEIQIVLNSLRMSISTLVPCVDSGEWKVPYEQLEKDFMHILKQLREYRRGIQNDKKQETPEESICETCD